MCVCSYVTVYVRDMNFYFAGVVDVLQVCWEFMFACIDMHVYDCGIHMSMMGNAGVCIQDLSVGGFAQEKHENTSTPTVKMKHAYLHEKNSCFACKGQVSNACSGFHRHH